MKRIFKFFIYIFLLLIISGVITFGSGWLWSVYRAENLEIPPEAELTPKSSIPLGGDLIVTLDFKLPIHRQIKNITVKPSPNMLIVGSPKTVSSWQWSKKHYHITVLLRPFRSKIENTGSLEIQISNSIFDSNGMETSKILIPSIKVNVEMDEMSKLKLAEEFNFSSLNISRHWLWAILIIPLFFLIFTFFHRRNVVTMLTLSEQTKIALEELQNHLKNGKIVPELVFVELTDLMKTFLEKRFNLSSSKQTTQEFMDNLKQYSLPLPEKYYPFLHEYMNIADLVKFAKLPPDVMLLEQAINKAEELVEFCSDSEQVKG